DKRSRVQKMFAAIAPKYDLNNRLHSFGMDQRWRRKAVKLAELAAADFVVDVACGTGDLTRAFLDEFERQLPEQCKLPNELDDRIVGVDFTFEMLPIAQRKADFLFDYPPFLNADATALPLADASADVVSIAFGIRNVQEPARALAEF